MIKFEDLSTDEIDNLCEVLGKKLKTNSKENLKVVDIIKNKGNRKNKNFGF